MPRVVIVGAGTAGLMLAKTLADSLSTADDTDVVVLEKSAFFFHTYGTPRALVDESYAPKLFIPFDNAIPERAAPFVKIVRGVATKLSSSPQQVSYRAIGDDDQEAAEETVLVYDYLVLATGSSYTAPLKEAPDSHSRKTTEAQVAELRAQIESAQRVLVIGAGPAGCEVASEIAAKFPEKRVILIGSASHLLANNNVSDKFRACLLDGLTTRLHVEVILGERLALPAGLTGNSFEPRTLETDKGRTVESDIQLLCTGFHPIADLVRDMDASLIDDRGRVRVNAQLQLAGGEHCRNMFGIGDVTDNPSPKQGYIAARQAQFLAGELLAVLRGKQRGFTKPFLNSELEWIPVPFGPDGGVMHLPFWGGIVVGDFLTWFLKSSDYFAGKFWGLLGATMPST